MRALGNVPEGAARNERKIRLPISQRIQRNRSMPGIPSSDPTWRGRFSADSGTPIEILRVFAVLAISMI